MKISIIIPSYNRGYIIGRTIDSILKQTHQDWECIVADDKSTDNTKDVIERYSVNDNRIRYMLNNRSKGAQGARNTGILASTGEWVVLFDSDNVMHPDFLEKCVDVLKSGNIDVVNTWSNVIDSKTGETIRYFQWVSNGDIYEGLLRGKCYVDNSSTVIRKNKLMEVELLSEDCPAFQEWDTHIRISRNARYKTIEKCLIDYYAGAADAISSDKRKDVRGYLFMLSKFRNEWLSVSKYHYIKYLAILNNKIQQLPSNQKQQYIEEYKQVADRLSLPASMMAFLSRMKNKMVVR